MDALLDRELPEDASLEKSLFRTSRAPPPLNDLWLPSELEEHADPLDKVTPRSKTSRHHGKEPSYSSDDDSFSIEVPLQKELAMNYMAVPQHLYDPTVSPPAPSKPRKSSGHKSKSGGVATTTTSSSTTTVATTAGASSGSSRDSPKQQRRRKKDKVDEEDDEDVDRDHARTAPWGPASPASSLSLSPLVGNAAMPATVVASMTRTSSLSTAGYATPADWTLDDEPQAAAARQPKATRVDKKEKKDKKEKRKKEKKDKAKDKAVEARHRSSPLSTSPGAAGLDSTKQHMTLAGAIAAANAHHGRTNDDDDGNGPDEEEEEDAVELSRTSTSPSDYDSTDGLLKRNKDKMKKTEAETRQEAKRKKKEEQEQAAAAAKLERKAQKEREKREKELRKREKRENRGGSKLRDAAQSQQATAEAEGPTHQQQQQQQQSPPQGDAVKRKSTGQAARSEKRDSGGGGIKADLLRETLAATRLAKGRPGSGVAEGDGDGGLNEYAHPRQLGPSRGSSPEASVRGNSSPHRSFSNSSLSSGSGSDDGRGSPSTMEKGSAEIKIIHVKTLELCAGLKSLILQVCKNQQRKNVLCKDDIDRLKYLYETVHLINFYVSSQSQENRKIRAYSLLLFPLYDALLQTHKMVGDVYRGQAAVTENFDIFELTLRRYLEQSNRLFPLEGDDRERPEPASSCIEDKKARQVWDRSVGPDVYFTTFATFIKKVIEPEFPEAKDETFQQHLRYFLNFPADDMLTVYKWNLLLRLFGPYDQFPRNFRSLVLERGFLGLINRIKAQEILLLEGSPSRLLLIRFSRTEPEFLAFSYKDERGQIRHSLNKEENDSKLPVPVAEYVQRKFPNFAVVNQKVNVRNMMSPGADNQLWSLTDYARQASSNAYILPSLPATSATDSTEVYSTQQQQQQSSGSGKKGRS